LVIQFLDLLGKCAERRSDREEERRGENGMEENVVGN
jgi:hypothetical protein